MKKFLFLAFVAVIGCSNESNHDVQQSTPEVSKQQTSAPAEVAVSTPAVEKEKSTLDMTIREFDTHPKKQEIIKSFTPEEKTFIQKAMMKYAMSQDTAKFLNMTLNEVIAEQKAGK